MKKTFLVTLIFAVLVLAGCKKNIDSDQTPTHSHVAYGIEDRQWLNLYLAESDEPTAVYIFAHSNGGTADNVQDFVSDLKAVGISTVSWESVTPVSTTADIETGWEDASLMFEWLKTNAATYNLDMNNVIIGGRSRGSIVSWKLAHSLDPAIKGIYMFQALPDGIWETPEIWDPVADVSADSPPIKLTYKHEPGTTDIHDPEHGITIVDRYSELGIEEKSALVHSLESDANLYSDIVEWCLTYLD